MGGALLSCEDLVEGHLDALHGYAMSRTRSSDLAKEVVQRAFLKAFEKRHQLRDPLAARGWLLTILRNELSMEYRAHARFVVWDSEDFDMVPGDCDETVDHEFVEALPSALAQLSEGARDILTLRFQQELSYDAIAELMAIPLGTVQSRIHRAKLALKTLLQSHSSRGGVA